MFGSWLFGIKGGHKNLLYMGLAFYVGPFGFAEMILFLIMLKSKRICRFFLGPHTWQGRGQYFTRRRIGTPSQQRVGPLNQPLWRSSRGMGGSLEIGFGFKTVSLPSLDVVVFIL